MDNTKKMVNFTNMKGTIKNGSINLNLKIAISDLFDFINLIIEAREDKLNKKGNKFNTIEKQKEELFCRVNVIAFCLDSLDEKAETSKRIKELIKIGVFERMHIFEKSAFEYSNTLKHISAKSFSFYQNINTAIHEARQEITNALFILSIGDEGIIQVRLGEERLKFSDALQAYVRSGLITSSPEYYEVHKAIFDKAYKMIHYAWMLSAIEDLIELPANEIVPYDLRLVCARLQYLCKNQDFIVSRNFVTKLFDLKLNNMDVILSDNLAHRAELKLDMLEYILLPKSFRVRLYFNSDVKKEDIYYLLRTLHKKSWVQKKLLQAMEGNTFFIKDGFNQTRVTYDAVTALLNNHDMKTNDKIDLLFV